jgi:predicted transcriptional regulator
LNKLNPFASQFKKRANVFPKVIYDYTQGTDEPIEYTKESEDDDNERYIEALDKWRLGMEGYSIYLPEREDVSPKVIYDYSKETDEPIQYVSGDIKYAEALDKWQQGMEGYSIYLSDREDVEPEVIYDYSQGASAVIKHKKKYNNKDYAEALDKWRQGAKDYSIYLSDRANVSPKVIYSQGPDAVTKHIKQNNNKEYAEALDKWRQGAKDYSIYLSDRANVSPKVIYDYSKGPSAVIKHIKQNVNY